MYLNSIIIKMRTFSGVKLIPFANDTNKIDFSSFVSEQLVRSKYIFGNYLGTKKL